MNLILIIIFLTNVLISCFAQNTANMCSSQITCSDCIQQAECVWCNVQNSSAIHCLRKEEKKKCENNKLENPQSEVIIISKDPTSIISPSKLNLKIRSKQLQKIDFNFTQPKDFPVDLYFLMDISYTMRDHRDKLASLASEIVSIMKNYTSDVRMGFGSFVDKPISPFVYTQNNKLINPCPDKDCNLPYSFQNHLSLTYDANLFSSEVNATKSSGNVDLPEGSLEALMQVIVCKNEIGWRENARKLIILSTDDAFHIAGDGKLAGIDKPNDGLCHLENNAYTHSLDQDYPSIGQISEKIKENNFIVIFAVTESAQKIFEQLRDRIHSSFIGILSAQATIVNILQNLFDNIANTVKINHNFGREFDIEFKSNCAKFNRINVSCPGIKPGDSISFTANLKLIQCSNNYTKTNYKIYPSGLNKHISIDVDYLCQCDCEKTGEKNSPICSNIGEFQCGICKCPSGKMGVSCECDGTDSDSSFDKNSCIQENSTEECSGAGYCYCGQCFCDNKTEERNKINGKYCECNNNPCYDDNDVECSNHGTCECGICNCKSGWNGLKCDCTESVDTCKASNSDEVCSGDKGNCVCGKCQCNIVNGHKFFGEYCQTCLTCPQCNYYRSCVECKIFKQGIYNEIQCEQNCGDYKIELTDDIEKIYIGESCIFRDDQNCLVKYKYDFNVEKNITTLFVQTEKEECARTASIAFWAGIPIISILAAVLIAIFIFKLISILQYRQEYAKFVQEREFEQNELNPLYKSPNVTVVNPLYDGQN